MSHKIITWMEWGDWEDVKKGIEEVKKILWSHSSVHLNHALKAHSHLINMQAVNLAN